MVILVGVKVILKDAVGDTGKDRMKWKAYIPKKEGNKDPHLH
jgi:hypothetical protein